MMNLVIDVTQQQFDDATSLLKQVHRDSDRESADINFVPTTIEAMVKRMIVDAASYLKV